MVVPLLPLVLPLLYLAYRLAQVRRGLDIDPTDMSQQPHSNSTPSPGPIASDPERKPKYRRRTKDKRKRSKKSVQKSDKDPSNQALTVYQELVKEFNRKPPKLDKCLKLLDQLKLLLTQISFLPTSNEVSKQDLIISRDCLEMGAQISVACRDIPAFERYLSQLKCYYFDFSDELPESAYKYQLLGLNLLCLLSQNRVAEFHTELELLPAHEIQNNIYIKHPVNLEQWLMEGCYNKVFLSKDNVPAESYAYFVDILLNTVREEIANCLQKAYETISVQEASRILFFNNPKDLSTFSVKRNWKAINNMFVFDPIEKVKPSFSKDIPCEQLACRALEYAKELEMIV